MSAEENKRIVRRYYAAFGENDWATIEGLTSPEWVNHDPALPPFEGIEGARNLYMMFKNGLPNFSVEIEDILADGDRVAVRSRAGGTQTGELLGIPPTGKHAMIAQMAIHRVADGKITDNWVVFDALTMMQELGAVPAPDQR